MTDTPLSLQMVKSVMSRYHKGMMKWHYEHGLMLYAALQCGKQYEDKSIYPWVYELYDDLICTDGSIKTYKEGEYNLDQINAGRALFELATTSKETRFYSSLLHLVSQLDSQPRCKCGVYWHKQIYPWQIWLDGLYMEGPFKCQYGALIGDDERIEDVVNQLITTYNLLKDEETGLLFHAYDETRGQRWSSPETGLSPHFWSRSIGWYFMAVLDVLDYVPLSMPKRSTLIEIATQLASAVVKMQDESGMWWQVTDQKGREGNYLETSASSMFAYSLYKGVRLGYLDKKYLKQAKAAIEGIKKLYLVSDNKGHLHLDGICSVAGLGGNPYRDGSFKYYVCEPRNLDDFKGVGPFTLALLESEIV